MNCNHGFYEHFPDGDQGEEISCERVEERRREQVAAAVNIEDFDCAKCGGMFCRHASCVYCGDPCDPCAEDQQQRWIEGYYGGDGPQTERERYETEAIPAWQQKRP